MADTKNAFDALKKGASWNDAAKKAKVLIEDKEGTAKTAKAIIEETKDPTKLRAVESAYNEILNDIKSTLKLGKEPKREDFINAVRKANNILTVLNDALKQDSVILHPKLIGILQEKVGIAINALNENKPGMVSAARKSVGSKMKSTVSGIIGGMASQLTEGVPFAPEMLAFAGAKIKGFGGGASSAQTDMAATLQDDGSGAEATGGATSPVEKAKEEILGGTSGGGNGGGLEFTNELLINIDDNLQFIRDNSETAESRRERLRAEKAKKTKGLVVKGKKGAGQEDEDGGGFLSSLLGTALGTGGIPGVGGGKKGQFMKAGGKGVASNLLKGPGLKTALSVMTVPLMGMLTPLLGFLMSPPGLIALAAAATAGGLWFAISKATEKKSSEDLSKDLEKVKSTEAVGAGRVTLAQAKILKENRIASLEKQLAEAKQRESGESETKKGRWEMQGRSRVWVPEVKMKKGGIVPGKKGEPTPVMAHGEEIFFDNDASEKMHENISLLEGTDFKSMEEFFAAGKSSAGFNILMDKYFTSAMLESKHGGMLKDTAMLFGLAGHGQLGKTKKHGTMVDKFSMGPETIEKLLEKLNFFKKRDEKIEKFGGARSKNNSELNAMRVIQEISKSMALLGDSPEERKALDRYEKMSMEEKILSEMSREEAEERGQALKIDLKQRWGNFLQGETDRNKQIFTSSQKIGQNLNTAQAEKDGMTTVAGSSPTVVSADTNIVNNNSSTFVPPIDPGGGMGRGLTARS